MMRMVARDAHGGEGCVVAKNAHGGAECVCLTAKYCFPAAVSANDCGSCKTTPVLLVSMLLTLFTCPDIPPRSRVACVPCDTVDLEFRMAMEEEWEGLSAIS